MTILACHARILGIVLPPHVPQTRAPVHQVDCADSTFKACPKPNFYPMPPPALLAKAPPSLSGKLHLLTGLPALLFHPLPEGCWEPGSGGATTQDKASSSHDHTEVIPSLRGLQSFSFFHFFCDLAFSLPAFPWHMRLPAGNSPP